MTIVFSYLTGLYNSFRTSREVNKQFNYHKFQNDNSEDSSHKLRPPRPPQPKSVSVPGDGAMEGLLIDLTDINLKPARSHTPGSKEVDDMSLLDSSIAEKYGHLPAPLGEKSHDPFEININFKSWTPPPYGGGSRGVSGGGGRLVGGAGFPLMSSNSGSASQISSQTSLGALHVTLPPATTTSPSNVFTGMPSPNSAFTSVTSTVSTSSSQYENQSQILQESALFSRTQTKSPSTLWTSPPCQLFPTAPVPSHGGASNLSPMHQAIPSQPVTSTSSRDTLSTLAVGGATHPGPPLPPRIYANLPADGAAKQPPLELPDKSKAMKLTPSTCSFSDGNKDGGENRVPAEMEAGLCVGNSHFYDDVAVENTDSPPGALVMRVSNNPVKVNKAFDWLSDSFSELKKEKCEKGEMSVVNTMKIEPINIDAKPKIYARIPSKRWGPPSGTLSPTSTLDSQSDWGDDFDESDDDVQPPALPPRDFVPVAGAVKNLKQNPPPPGPQPIPKEGMYRNLPRILPVFKDGKRVSTDHYFVIPQWSPQPQTAEVKPFAVGGKQVSTTASLNKKSDPYQNLNAMNPILDQATNLHRKPDIMPSKSPLPDPWAHLTGLKVVTPDTDTVPSQLGSLGTTGSSQQSPQEKVYAVQQEVHGVTQEESQTALANNGWSVTAAVHYLKVEQLFRLGITSRDRCQKLLESFQWNLELAGSVLLDELSTGSAV